MTAPIGVRMGRPSAAAVLERRQREVETFIKGSLTGRLRARVHARDSDEEQQVRQLLLSQSVLLCVGRAARRLLLCSELYSLGPDMFVQRGAREEAQASADKLQLAKHAAENRCSGCTRVSKRH